MIKAVLFDLDGTLLDSLNVWERVDDLFLERRSIEVPSDYHEALLHLRFIEAAHYTIDRFQLDEKVESIMEEWMNLAREMYEHHIECKPGVYDFVVDLKQKGYKLAIVTSCHQELFEPCLKRHGLWSYFDVIVEANRINMSKTSSEIYDYTLQQLHLKASECLFFDDVYTSLKAAKGLGINVIAIKDPLSYDSRTETLTNKIIIDFKKIPHRF